MIPTWFKYCTAFRAPSLVCVLQCVPHSEHSAEFKSQFWCVKYCRYKTTTSYARKEWVCIKCTNNFPPPWVQPPSINKICSTRQQLFSRIHKTWHPNCFPIENLATVRHLPVPIVRSDQSIAPWLWAFLTTLVVNSPYHDPFVPTNTRQHS